MCLEVDRSKSTKSLWNILKKLYGNEPTTTRSNCERKKVEGANKCTNDDGGLDIYYNKDENESHLLMALRTQDEERTYCYDNVSPSYVQDPFGSDDSEEDEEIEDEFDLEGELVSAIEELGKVRREYKKFKNVAIEEHDRLNKFLQES